MYILLHLYINECIVYTYTHKCMCVCMCVCGCVCICQPLRTSRMWHEVNFQVEFKRFEFRLLLLIYIYIYIYI